MQTTHYGYDKLFTHLTVPRHAKLFRKLRQWFKQSWLLYAALYIVMRAFSILPLNVGRLLGKLGGSAAFLVDWKNVHRGMANLTVAFPSYSRIQCRHILKNCYRHLGVCLIEACHFRTASPEWLLRDWIERNAESDEVMRSALSEKKGVICVSAHAGFWELTGFIFPSMGYPCVCIANKIEVLRINAEIRKIRARLGNEIVDQEGALIPILRGLKEGKTVGIIMDHWGKNKSPLVPFFGRDTRTIDTVARLHLKTGAPIVSSMMIRQSNGRYRWRCKRIIVPIEQESSNEQRVIEILSLCNRDIEAAIRQNPEQWTWMHNRWRNF